MELARKEREFHVDRGKQARSCSTVVGKGTFKGLKKVSML